MASIANAAVETEAYDITLSAWRPKDSKQQQTHRATISTGGNTMRISTNAALPYSQFVVRLISHLVMMAGGN